MTKLTTSILLAGVMAATMIGAVHSAPATPTAASSSLEAKAPVLGYRFATVIKTQALREQVGNNSSSITNAKADAQLIYSPAYPNLETCKAASAAVSQLLGADIAIKAGPSTASATYKSSECLPSMGP